MISNLLIEKFANWLEKRGRRRNIMDRDGKTLYMRRYYPLFCDLKAKTGKDDEHQNWTFNILLHNIVLSDRPVFHSHPWGFVTLILTGGYWEHLPGNVIEHESGLKEYQPSKRIWRGPGSIIRHKAIDYHWLEVPDNGKKCWTLFFHTKRIRKWGFLVGDQEIYWKTYLENNKDDR